MIALLAALASAAAWFFSTGAHDVWVLAWIAPAPVLAYAYRASARRAAAAAFAAALLGGGTWLPLYLHVLPALALAFAIVGLAVVFTVVVLGARWIWRRQPVHVGLFAFPVLAAGADYLISRVSVDGSAGSLAYSQVGVGPVLQVASVTGLWGITFLLALAASGVAVAWLRRTRLREVGLALGVPAAIIAVALGWGWFRLSRAPSMPTVRVGLVADDGMVRYEGTGHTSEALSVVRAYVAQIDALAAAGAHVALLPEKLVTLTPGDRDQARQIFAAAARRNRIVVIAGVDLRDGAKRNEAWVFTPAGDLAIRYEKQHLVEGLERGYVRGRSVAVWTDSAWMYGVAICKDLDFPALGRAYGDRKVGVLFVPAWDFVRDGRLHARMAIVRGVENGFSLVRTAQQGRLTVTDPYGRILAEQPSDGATATRLTADVPVRHVSTAYDEIGDWFAWACLIVAAGMFLGSSRAPGSGLQASVQPESGGPRP